MEGVKHWYNMFKNRSSYIAFKLGMGYIRYILTYTIQCAVTDSIFSLESWVNLLVHKFSC